MSKTCRACGLPLPSGGFDEHVADVECVIACRARIAELEALLREAKGWMGKNNPSGPSVGTWPDWSLPSRIDAALGREHPLFS